jgi:acyl carrier protein
MTARISAHDRARLRNLGLEPLSEETALAALDAVMAAETPADGRIAILHPNPLAQTDRAASLFAALQGATRPKPSPAAQAAPEQAAPDFIVQWSTTVAGKRREMLLAFIRAQAVKVLGLPARQEIPKRKPLGELGLDSLMAVELRNSLSAAIGVHLPATLLFDYPTVEALEGYLRRHLPQDDEITAAPSVPLPGATKHADVAALSDAEAEALLLAELGEGD